LLTSSQNDVRLVTTNAKTFNPPGTIYYTEAERIETYAIDHINKAAASVIEYETDWNIDVERDEEPQAQTPLLDNDDRDTPMDVDGSTRARSPSVASTHTPVSRRGQKQKKEPGMLSESLEPDGHLPGYKDGVGQFPPGSEWAELMLSLKMKGKRYRTKKERLRVEKSGPPCTAEGSIDYTQMEDPFSVLSILLPEPRSKPPLASLYQSSDPYFPSPVNLPPNRPEPQLRTVENPKGTKPKRRHWTIVRNTPGRRGKDREAAGDEELPEWKVPHAPHSTDYGVFATLVGHVSHEYRVQNIGTDLGSEAQLFGVLRHSIDRGVSWKHPSWTNDDLDLSEEGYWARRGRGAEDFLRDVVYGGVDGLAYVRSLAEFVKSPPQEVRTCTLHTCTMSNSYPGTDATSYATHI
jgi:bromodomain-containing protein 7